MKPSVPSLLTLSLCAALGAAGTARAADAVFDTNPFAGSTANPDDGIRVVFTGNQRSLPSFDVAGDRFVFDAAVFDVGGALSFANGLTASLPASGPNVIVVLDTGSGFNAGTAANLIADALTSDGAGIFMYSNVGLGVNRLVYSTNLNLNTADLSVLARIESPFAPDALPALAGFGADNFALAPVPEPGSYALLLGGLTMLGTWARRRLNLNVKADSRTA